MYMYAAAIKLAGRKDRLENPQAVLIPGRQTGSVDRQQPGFSGGARRHRLSPDPARRFLQQTQLRTKTGRGTVASVVLGLVLYFRGVRDKSRTA